MIFSPVGIFLLFTTWTNTQGNNKVLVFYLPQDGCPIPPSLNCVGSEEISVELRKISGNLGISISVSVPALLSQTCHSDECAFNAGSERSTVAPDLKQWATKTLPLKLINIWGLTGLDGDAKSWLIHTDNFSKTEPEHDTELYTTKIQHVRL